jgi:hypothetical protein
MGNSAYHHLICQTSVCLLIVAIAFVGINIAAPSAIPPAHGQSIGTIAGVILGLAIIAGTVYLITRDRNGVYYRYPYGQYYPNGYASGYTGYNGYNAYNTNRVHYRYYGPYAQQYPMYQGRWYGGPMPRAWYGDRGCYGSALRSGRCM